MESENPPNDYVVVVVPLFPNIIEILPLSRRVSKDCTTIMPFVHCGDAPSIADGFKSAYP